MNNLCLSILFNIYDSLTDEESKKAMSQIINNSNDLSKITDERLFNKLPGGIIVERPKVEVNDDYKDFRCKNVIFDNFRTFPHHNPPYGLSLINDDKQVCSGFFLAGNGVGKTTIFSGLEQYYTGKVSEETANYLQGKDKEDYVKFGFGEFPLDPKPTADVFSPRDNKEPVKEKYGSSLSPFFISDFDVTSLRQYDITEYVLSQLGVNDLRQLEGQLINLIRSYGEKESVPQLNKEEVAGLSAYILKNIEDTDFRRTILSIDSTDEEIMRFWANGTFPDYLLPEQIANAHNSSYNDKKKNITVDSSVGGIDIPEEISQDNFENLLDAFNRIKEAVTSWLPNASGIAPDLFKSLFIDCANSYAFAPAYSISQEDTSNRKVIISNIYRFISNELYKLKESFVNDWKDIIVESLSTFSGDEDKEIDFSLVNGKIEAKITVHTEKGNFPAMPKMYYNTFRFKLYAVAVKIAMCLQIMKSLHILVPIVIDDVFSASDFDNSIELKKFVGQIYETYEKTIKSGKNLQIILLTHDDGIQQTFASASVNEPFIAKRIFSYKDIPLDEKAGKLNNKFINLYL